MKRKLGYAMAALALLLLLGCIGVWLAAIWATEDELISNLGDTGLVLFSVVIISGGAAAFLLEGDS
jgi:hypothetical protein